MGGSSIADAVIARRPFVVGHRADGTLLQNYFDGHRVLGDPALLSLIATDLCTAIHACGADAVAGEISAGSSLATAIALASLASGHPVEARGIRLAGKAYGVSGLLTSPLPPGTRVALVDDVVGTGAALIRSLASVRASGHVVVGAFVILERDPDVRTVLADHGIDLYASLTLDDLARAQA
jgi:orotate phosphoribosyltransferase